LGGIAKLSSPKFGSNNMAKGKVTTNITQNKYVYIDGATGQTLTREQFIQKHSGVNPVGHRPNVAENPREETQGENK
jgi:hypothetical protein